MGIRKTYKKSLQLAEIVYTSICYELNTFDSFTQGTVRWLSFIPEAVETLHEKFKKDLQ